MKTPSRKRRTRWVTGDTASWYPQPFGYPGIKLRRADWISIGDVAKILGCSYTTAGNRLRRALGVETVSYAAQDGWDTVYIESRVCLRRTVIKDVLKWESALFYGEPEQVFVRGFRRMVPRLLHPESHHRADINSSDN